MCCPLMATPRHKKEAILVRIFQGHESSAPAFIDGRLHVCSSGNQIFIKLTDVFDTDEEVNAPSATQHRLEVLRQCDSQITRAQSRHRRIRVVVERLDLHPQHSLVKSK